MKQFLTYNVVFLSLMLSACEGSSVQQTLGLSREAPDEFTVVSRPPLTVPPEFNLRPPAPGEAPRGVSAGEVARGVLTGKPAVANAGLTGAPVGETAVVPVERSDVLSHGANSLLKRAGAGSVDESIRSKLSVDAATPADTSNATSLMEKITGAQKQEPTVDAKKEVERLRANKEAGKPVTEGAVPEEKPHKKSLIDRIF